MANRRPEYSPLTAPPNPRAEQAREAKREYMKQMLHQVEAPEPHATFTAEEHDAMMTLALECSIDEQQRRDKEKQEQDAAKIAAALAQWPAIARHHLRVGVGMAWDAEQRVSVEKSGVVMYDTGEDDAVPPVGGMSDTHDATRKGE